MADYDSDSSSGEDIETAVLLGYASKEATGDDFSQLGGYPIWLDLKTAPDGELAKCKVCNGLMNLLLQINGDSVERFPTHQRRLYLWSCRKKQCRRKVGSCRAFRALRVTEKEEQVEEVKKEEKSKVNLGETLFGVKSPSNTPANPFAAPSSNGTATNPFSSAPGSGQANPFSATSIPSIKADDDDLPQTFAEKARIASPPPTSSPSTPQRTPWPSPSAFPSPFPTYYIDADKEYIDASPSDTTPAGVRIEQENGEGSSAAADTKELFESSMDKTFQRFADRLSQNPEQVLRYEFAGQPLLYSKTDAVGKIFADAQQENVKVKTASSVNGTSKLPRCWNCGGERVFELQLTPHAITELEAEDMSIEGMDWGTIILGSCSRDCQEKGVKAGEVGYVEEWVGVQWEELEEKKRVG